MHLQIEYNNLIKKYNLKLNANNFTYTIAEEVFKDIIEELLLEQERIKSLMRLMV